jgi:type VI secretion system secreted protein VgrG
VFIPRIDHEVVVDFIEGDPDRPIITGCVYHGANTPPYSLPGEKTKSVIKSNSSAGGGGFNELRFEDKKGSEEIFIHGQKDCNITINNNKTQNIGNDEKLTVSNNREKNVSNNQKETIGAEKKITVGSNHKETIGSEQTITVGSNRNLTVGGDEVVSVAASRSVTVAASQKHNIAAEKSVNCSTETLNVAGQRTINVGGMEQKTIGGMRQITAATENYTVGGIRTITVGNELKTIANQQTFLGMDVTTDSGAKFENFAGIKVSNAFALLMELKQINISIANAVIGYTSFKLDQDGIKVNTNALHVIG